MPIKLKKYNIQYGLDNPETGYMILGFDERGRLVSKDSDGTYATIIPLIPSGNFQDITTDYLTVGIRLPSANKGLYSIGQGDNISATGLYSYAQGLNSDSTGSGSTAVGQYVVASGNYSYSGGMGFNNSFKLTSAGITSFVHSFAADANNVYGTVANYSVILGGRNHIIQASADNSVILGGFQNIISAGNTSVTVISCNNLTTALDDVVYMPRIVLIDGGGYGGQHSAGNIEYQAGRYKGYTGPSTFTYLDDIDITASLSVEISNRIVGDASVTSALVNALSVETSNRVANDGTLSNSIVTEAGIRSGADSTLSSAISTEAGTRAGSDSTLSTAISSEGTTRLSVDNSLSFEISDLMSGDINLIYDTTYLTSDITSIATNTWRTAKQLTIPSSGKWLVTANITSSDLTGDNEFRSSARLRTNNLGVIASSETAQTDYFGGSQLMCSSITLTAIIAEPFGDTVYLDAFKDNNTPGLWTIHSITPGASSQGHATVLSIVKIAN